MSDDPKQPDDGDKPVRDAQAQPAATKAVEAAESVEAREQAKAAKDAALAALEVDDKPAVKAETRPAPKAATVSPLDKALPLPAKKTEPAKKAEAKPEPKKEPKPDPEDDPNRLPEAPPWWKTLRADPPTHISALLGIGLIVVIFGVWWLVTHGSPTGRIISPSKLPSPAMAEVAGVYPKVMQDGAMDAGAWSCGMVAGLIHDIPTVKELIDRIMAEAGEIIRGRLMGFVNA